VRKSPHPSTTSCPSLAAHQPSGAPQVREGARDRGEVSLQDGRIYLETPGPKYGLIFLDAFASDSPPYHLFTQEAFSAMKSRLEPGGILAVNMVTIVRGSGNATWKSLYRTLSSVFPHVRIFQASDTYEDLGNVILFCSEGPLDGPTKVRPEAQTDLALMMGRELTAQAAQASDGILMTDDHAPLEFLIARTAARWRTQLQRKISDIMLY
jgi:spermidine synthase